MPLGGRERARGREAEGAAGARRRHAQEGSAFQHRGCLPEVAALVAGAACAHIAA